MPRREIVIDGNLYGDERDQNHQDGVLFYIVETVAAKPPLRRAVGRGR
ncbi:hypothetical protein X011_17755 [Mycobacterium tuberculosis variant microti OV254]|nr:hypothetical protein X011_17755 [Mycobacterium tuberculosis variant microti OV254]